MSQLKSTFVRLVVVALIAPALVAGCAELGQGEKGSNSAVDSQSAMQSRVERPMPRVR